MSAPVVDSHDPLSALIGAAVAAGLLEDGLRSAIAARLGVARQLIAAWDAGRQPVSAEMLPRLQAIDPLSLGRPPLPGVSARPSVDVPPWLAQAIVAASSRGAATSFARHALAAYVAALRDGGPVPEPMPGPHVRIRPLVRASDLARLGQAVGPGLDLRRLHLAEALRRAAER